MPVSILRTLPKWNKRCDIKVWQRLVFSYAPVQTRVLNTSLQSVIAFRRRKRSKKMFGYVAFGVAALIVGYFITRRKRIGECKEKEGKDPFDGLLDQIKIRLDKIGSKIDTNLDELYQSIKDSMLSPKMQEALYVIKDILVQLKEFDLNGEAFNIPLPILLAVIKKGQDKKIIKDWHQTLPFCSDVERTKFEEGKHFGAYALKVYRASLFEDKNYVANQMEIADDDIVFYHFDAHESCPSFVLFLDRQAESVVLAIRGTFSVQDVITDIICDERPFLHGFAHKGILEGAENVVEISQDKLSRVLRAYPEYKFVITGHSLGAGTAELVYLSLMRQKDALFGVDRKVQCIALAPPPVFRADKALKDEIENGIDIFINNNDCVPRLSLGVVAKLMASARAVDALGLTFYEHMEILADKEDTRVHENFENVKTAIATVKQERFPLLTHIGNIHYFHRHDNTLRRYNALRQPANLFSEHLLLFESMVVDHLGVYYKEAFANCDFPISTEDKDETTD